MDDILIRTRGKSAINGPQARRQPHTYDDPRVRRHESVAPPAAMQSARCYTNDADTEPRVHECFIQESPFVWRHAAILSRLAVEYHIRGDDGSAHDGGTV